MIYFTDAVDEYVMQHMPEYDEKKFQNASKDNLKLGGKDDKEKKADKALRARPFQHYYPTFMLIILSSRHICCQLKKIVKDCKPPECSDEGRRCESKHDVLTAGRYYSEGDISPAYPVQEAFKPLVGWWKVVLGSEVSNVKVTGFFLSCNGKTCHLNFVWRWDSQGSALRAMQLLPFILFRMLL